MSDRSRATPGKGGYAAGFVPAPFDVVGKIELLSGSVTVTRANGIFFLPKVGDPVFPGDIIETVANGRVGIRFIDGTAFSLSDGGRMVVKEFACGGASPSALFDVAQGTFAFVAGEMAEAGRLGINTPFARIRGRTGGIGILSLAALFFTAMEEVRASSSSSSTDDGNISCKDLGPYGVVELTTHGIPGVSTPQTISLDNPCLSISIHANGSSEQTPLTPAQMAQLHVQQQDALHIFALGLQQGPTINGTRGSSTDPNLLFGRHLFQPINFIPPDDAFVPKNPGSGPTNSPNSTPDELSYVYSPIPAAIVIAPIAGDNIVNPSEASAGFAISGTTTWVHDGRTVTITIFRGSTVVDTFTTTVTGSAWSISVPSSENLADGSYRIAAQTTATDLFGGNISVTDLRTLLVDSEVVLPGAALHEDTGSSGSDGITMNGQVDVTLAADVASWQYSTDGGLHWTTGSGTSFTLAEGIYAAGQVQVLQTDIAGNVSSAFSMGAITVDTTAPTTAVTIDDGGDGHINNSEQGAVGFSVTGLDAGSTAVVTFTDGNYTLSVNVSGNGSQTAVDLSGFDDGTITATIVATDTAGNSASGTSDTSVKDTTADADGNLSITAPDLVNGDDPAHVSFDLAGLDPDLTAVTVTFADQFGHEVTLSLIDLQTQDPNVITNGGGTFTADLSGLDDGLVSVRVDVTDDAGNTTFATDNDIDLDTSADVEDGNLSITAPDLVNGDDPAHVSFDLAGLDPDLTAVTVTFADQFGHEVTLSLIDLQTQDPNVITNGGGTFTADLSGLDDGLVSVRVDVTDDAGNTTFATDNDIDLDTSADVEDGNLSITAPDLVNGDDPAHVSFDLAGLDPDLTAVTVTFADQFGHEVTLSLIDLQTQDPNVITNGGGTFTADLSGLDDGLVSVRVDVTDDAGNTTFATDNDIDLDTSADVEDGNLSITAPDLVNGDDPAHVSFDLAGLDPDLTAVTVTFADQFGHEVTLSLIDLQTQDPNVIANGGGAFTADLSGLDDGLVSVRVDVTDDAGNTTFATDNDIDLDTSADVEDGNLSITAPDLVNGDDPAHVSFDLAGLDPDLTAVTVTFADQFGHEVTLSLIDLQTQDPNVIANGGGAFTADLSGLDDGLVSVRVDVTDDAGNTTFATDNDIDLDTSADVEDGNLSITAPDLVNGDDPAHVSFDLAGLDPDLTAVTVTFADQFGHEVTLSLIDLQTQDPNVIANGGGTFTADLSGLDDGLVSVRVDVTDDAGNTTFATDNDIDLDTSADVEDGNLSITAPDLVNGDDPAHVSFDLAGLDPDLTAVTVTFADQFGHEVTLSLIDLQTQDPNVIANGGGTFTADLSGLDDGLVSVRVDVTDDAGNTTFATDNDIDLDTSADVEDGNLSITAPDLVNGDDPAHVSFDLAGLDPDLTAVTVTFADQFGHEVTLSLIDLQTQDPNVITNGGGTFTADLSGLDDGLVSVRVDVTDDAGNTTFATDNDIDLDTSADVEDGNLSITAPDLVNGDDPAHVSFDLAGLDPDLTAVTVTFADQFGHEVTLSLIDLQTQDPNVITNGGGTFTADLSGLDDGLVSVRVDVTDDAGNTTFATDNDIDLDTTATAPTITSVIDDTDPLTGPLPTDGLITADGTSITNDTDLTVQVSLDGTGAMAGDTIQLYDGTGTGSPLGVSYTLTQIDIDAGYANVQTGTLADGEYTITARITDVAGNQSDASNSFEVLEISSMLIVLDGQTKTFNSDPLPYQFIWVEDGGTLKGHGSIDASFLKNDGTLAADSNNPLIIYSAVMGTGTLLITNNTTLDLEGPVGSGQTIVFANGVGATGELILGDLSEFYGQLLNFHDTDSITLKDITYDHYLYVDDASSFDTGGTLYITDSSGHEYTIIFADGEYTDANFTFSLDGQGNTIIVDPPASTTTVDATATSLLTDATLTTGTDTITLADGTNQISGTDATVNNGDTVTGGASTDTLVIDNGNGDHSFIFGDGHHSDIGLSNFENLTLTDGNADAGHGDRITVTFDSHFQNNETMTVDGSALHNLTGTNLTIDAHLATHDSFVFIGSEGADTLQGGSHNDTIIGGGGGDFLAGGGGNDTFVFKAITDSQSGVGHFDAVTDFAAGVDHIDFSAISGLNSSIQAVNIQLLTSTPETIAAHMIDIVTNNGDTVIYANASETTQDIGSADMEIHLTNVTNVQSTDFIIFH